MRPRPDKAPSHPKLAEHMDQGGQESPQEQGCQQDSEKRHTDSVTVWVRNLQPTETPAANPRVCQAAVDLSKYLYLPRPSSCLGTRKQAAS